MSDYSDDLESAYQQLYTGKAPNTSTTHNLLSQLAQPQNRSVRVDGHEHPLRMITADALEEEGRQAEADLLRQPGHCVVDENGWVRPGKFVWEDAYYDNSEGGQYEDDEGHWTPSYWDRIHEDGPETVFDDLNRDIGSMGLDEARLNNRVHEQPPWGKSDRTWTSPEGHVLSWHPWGHVTLNYRHEVPDTSEHQYPD